MLAFWIGFTIFMIVGLVFMLKLQKKAKEAAKNAEDDELITPVIQIKIFPNLGLDQRLIVHKPKE